VFAADLDGDGDRDVLSASNADDTISWYPNGPEARATYRNSGSNPASHVAATLPVLGTSYRATVDLGSTTGHDLALLAGYATPLTLPLSGGQVLLVNTADPGGELLGRTPTAGPLASFDVPIPVDVTLLGYELATQALHCSGVLPFALSNALDLRLGY